MSKGAQPHAINLRKAHEDVKIMQPPRRIFSGSPFYPANVVGFRIDPELATEKVFFFPPGIHAQEEAALSIQSFFSE